MRIKIGIVDPEIGLLRIQTSSEQVRGLTEKDMEEAFGRLLKELLNQVRQELRSGSTSYVDKTLHTAKKVRLND